MACSRFNPLANAKMEHDFAKDHLNQALYKRMIYLISSLDIKKAAYDDGLLS